MTETTPKKTKTSNLAQMHAWEMTTSILVGMRQARDRAREEYAAACAEAGQNPHAPGLRKYQLMIEALNDALAAFEPDLHMIARSNDLTMPAVKR